MTEQRQRSNQLTSLVEEYLGLESMEVTEILLDMCGVSIDARVLPLLRQRLQEEEAQVSWLEARGYIRMSEKSKQLMESLTSLIASLEQTTQEDNA